MQGTIGVMVNTRQKGRQLEKHVSASLVSGGACTYAEPVDSGQGKDKREIRTDANIQGRLLNIECKNHKNLSVKEWWKQVKDSSALTDTVPSLCFSIHGTGEKLVTLSLEDFTELLASQGQKEENEIVRKALMEYQKKKERLNEARLQRKRAYNKSKKRKKDLAERDPFIIYD